MHSCLTYQINGRLLNWYRYSGRRTCYWCLIYFLILYVCTILVLYTRIYLADLWFPIWIIIHFSNTYFPPSSIGIPVHRSLDAFYSFFHYSKTIYRIQIDCVCARALASKDKCLHYKLYGFFISNCIAHCVFNIRYGIWQHTDYLMNLFIRRRAHHQTDWKKILKE